MENVIPTGGRSMIVKLWYGPDEYEYIRLGPHSEVRPKQKQECTCWEYI